MIDMSHAFIDRNGKVRENVRIEGVWYEIKTDLDFKLLRQFQNNEPQDEELIDALRMR